MLIRRSLLKIIDNTNISSIRIFQVYNKTGVAKVGSLVKGSIISIKKNCKFKRGEVVQAIVTITKAPTKVCIRSKNTLLDTGQTLSTTINAGVIVNKDLNPIGSYSKYGTFDVIKQHPALEKIIDKKL